MDRSREGREQFVARTKEHPVHSREMLFLAEQAAEGGLRALPSTEWALHYPVPPDVRQEKLRDFLDGKETPDAVAHALTPDAIFYNTQDITTDGVEVVAARIRDASAFVAHYDYPRFARFVAAMRGGQIPLKTLESLYRDVTHTRTQKKLMDAYGATGRAQMEQALHAEATRMGTTMGTLSRPEKVLQALKLDWLCDDRAVINTEERDRMVAGLSGDERELFNRMRTAYRTYVQRGEEGSWDEMVRMLRESLPEMTREEPQEGQSESMEELAKELEQHMEKVGPVGSPEDPAIPPEDSDDYHTPPPMPGESREQTRARPLFEITPPLAGYYASGRKSYFDTATKTWSKKKQLSPYNATLPSEKRWRIAGVTDRGVKSLPLPNGYALDRASLTFEGAEPEIFRDQNGCFYVKTDTPSRFAVDFTEEPSVFVGPPIPEDTQALTNGKFSEPTEALMVRLTGNALHKAEQVRQYLRAHHFYPGGGDQHAAQALQYKLRTESTGDQYMQSLDTSEYLECYSANTLFIALMRRAGIPTRLVIGHKVEGARSGKSAIDLSNGHAWAEVFDGSAWRRFDATPQPKSEDKKPPQQEEQQESAPQASDDGVDGTPDATQGKAGEEASGASSETGTMQEGSEAAKQSAEEQLQRAREAVDRTEKQKQDIAERISNAEHSRDLEKMQDEIEKSDLFQDQKDELKEKLEAKEQEMKGEMQDRIDEMTDDGFISEDERRAWEEKLRESSLKELQELERALAREEAPYREYEAVREEVMPLVEQWFKYFAERLPRQQEVGVDEDALTRQGVFKRRAAMKPRNLLFGTVKNPREIRPSVQPRFLASILIDVSGSMKEGAKLENARKLAVFYAELFSRISEAFGYIQFSLHVFADSLTEIKGFDQDYDAPTRYTFADGMNATVKVRLMESLAASGGTNMLDAIRSIADDLQEEKRKYPDYASALYFIGDGGDTCGNAANIRKFLQTNEMEHGFGEHMRSAIFLGNDTQRQTLAAIFGDEHTTVAPDFNLLIERAMEQFDGDIEEYLRGKAV